MARKAANRLTPKGVLALKKEGYHADSNAVGLYVQVAHRQRGGKLDKKNGISKSWVYRFTSPVTKKVRMMGLGPCDVIPLAKAREMAKTCRGLVTLGGDPIEARNEKRVAVRKAYLKEQATKVTFAQCVKQYLAENLEKFKNPKHRRQWTETLARANRAFGDLPVSEIDTPTITKFLTPIWHKTPETGSRLRGRIEKILEWAKVREFRGGDNPAAWKGHLEHVFNPAEGGHYKPMPYEDVPAFMVHLRERDSLAAKALEFLVLTAVRSGDIYNATWDQIDLNKKLWNIPRTKMGTSHIVPLSERAIEIIKALPHVGDFVFPGNIEGKSISDNTMRKLFKKLDPNGYDIHAFRSSFKDWSGDETVFEDEVSEHALAHQEGSDTKRAYRRRTAVKKRALLMEAWADYCKGVERGSNVVPMLG